MSAADAPNSKLDEGEDDASSPERFSRAGASVAALLAALPFASMGGAVAFAPLVTITGVLGAPWRSFFNAVGKGGLALVLAAAFVGWATASSWWSPDPNAKQIAAAFLVTAIGGVLFATAAGRLSAVDRNLARRAGAAGVALLFIFASIEAWFNFPIGRALATQASFASAAGSDDANIAGLMVDAQRAVAIALICVGGGVALLAPLGVRGRALAIALACASISLSGAFGTPNNFAAVICGALAAVLALNWPRATISILGQVVAGWIVVAPLVMPMFADLAVQGFKQFAGQDASFVWQARAETWSYIADKVRERLAFGWGLQSSGHFGETYSLLGFTLPYVPRHPHNGPLQIWLETGAIGAMLAAGALASFGRRAGAALANDRWAAAGAAAALATAAVLANVSAGAWSLWWWVAIAVGAGLVRLARRSV